MIAKQFLEGTGLIDSSIALTAEFPDINMLIEDPEWNKIIANNFNIRYKEGYYSVSNNEREVIFLNEEDLMKIDSLLSDACIKRLIFIFRRKKIISEITKTILTQHRISLLELPVPKLENEYAKSLLKTNNYRTYLNNSYCSPQFKFWYDLFIGIIGSIVASYFQFFK